MARWGQCDYRQLQRLQQELQRFQTAELDAFCRKASAALAARLLTRVIKRTPVGVAPNLGARTVKVTGQSGKKYKMLTRAGEIYENYWAGYMGGTLRRGWTAKTEQEAQSGGGQDPVAYAASLPIAQNGGTYTIEIVNPVSYASYVEFGHRQQPGRYVPALGKQLKVAWVEGRFMLTMSEQEIKALAPGVLQQMLEQALREVFRA